MLCFGRDGEVQLWPEEEPRLHQVIERYQGVRQVQREKNKVDLSSYVAANRKKLEEELEQTRRANGESERDLVNELESKMQKLRERIQFLNYCAGQQFRHKNYHFTAPGYSGFGYQNLVDDGDKSMFYQPQPLQVFPTAVPPQQPMFNNLDFSMCHQTTPFQAMTEPLELPSTPYEAELPFGLPS